MCVLMKDSFQGVELRPQYLKVEFSDESEETT